MKTILFLTCASLALLPTLYATDVYTIPEGFQTYTLYGKRNNYIGLTLTPDPVYAGTVSVVSGNTVTVATTNPLPAEVAGLSAASPFFVKFLTGAQTGRIVQIVTATAATTGGTTPNGGTFTIDPTDNLGARLAVFPIALAATTGFPATGNTSGLTPGNSVFNVVSGDTLEILPGDTLTTLFGDNTTDNPLSLVGSSVSGNADTIGFSPMVGNGLQAFYFNNGKLNSWTSSSGTAATAVSANDTVIPPYAEMNIFMRGLGTENVTIYGRVSQVPLLTRTIGQHTVYASLKCPVDETLQQIGSGLSANWAQGNSSLADTIGVQRLINLNGTVYYSSTIYYENGGHWFTSAGAPADTASIASGAFLALKRAGNYTGPPLFLQSALPPTVSN